MEDNDQDNILVLTTRKGSAQSLRSFCQQSRRNTNVETAVKVAGATARHCIVLHGQSSFLSGHSNQSDFDKERYTRANVAFSRATDLTALACPVNMHGLTGATQVIGALLHGVCTIHTSDKAPNATRVEGNFEVGTQGVQAATATFLDAMEPHSLWDGPTPTCLVEHYCGEARRLRLVLTSQSRLSKGELKLLMSSTHPIHGSGLLFRICSRWAREPGLASCPGCQPSPVIVFPRVRTPCQPNPKTPKQQNQNTHKKHNQATTRNPSNLVVFPLYGSETGEKSDCIKCKVHPSVGESL